MRRLLFIIFIFCTLSADCQNWVQKSSFPGASKRNAEMFQIGRKAYLTTGLDTFSNRLAETWEYNMQNDQWSRKADFPDSLGRSGGIALSYGDSLGIAGLGWIGGGSANKDIYGYNPINNQWSLITNYPGLGGRNSFAAIMGDYLYVGAGGSNHTYYNDFWEYDFSNDQWKPLSNLPFLPRVGGVSIALDSVVYFGMGHNSVFGYKDLWAFDTRTQVWTQLADFPGSPRMNSVIINLNGELIVGGGHELGIGTAKTDWYRYNIATNQWTVLTPPALARSRTNSAFFSNGTIAYVVGGFSGNKNSMTQLNDVWEISNQTVSLSEEVKLEDNYQFYPIPFDNEFSLNWNSSVAGELTIFDISGKLVGRYSVKEGVNQYSIANPTSAVLLYQIISEGKSYNGKLIHSH